MRQAMADKEITIFGDGKQIRDYVYVSDLVGLFLRAGVSQQAVGGVFNAGSGVGSHFIDAVETVVKIVGKGEVKHVPWPADYENIETGGFVADIFEPDGTESVPYFRVRVGQFATQEEAREVGSNLRRMFPRQIQNFWIIPTEE